MKIAIFRPNTVMASWTNWIIPDALREMGHEIVDAALPGSLAELLISRGQYELIARSLPTIERLRSCDAVWVIAPEFLSVWLRELYGNAWNTLQKRVHLYVESSRRKDVSLDYQNLTQESEIRFYPDPYDAEIFDGHYLRGCVDTGMFAPGTDGKVYDAAFVGSLYPARIEFVRQLRPLIQGIDLRLGSVNVSDLSGELKREWAELLVKNMRQSKIHLCLPSNNSAMMVARPLETMACGTFCLTYRTDDHAFTQQQCPTYDPGNLPELADRLRYYLSHDAEREQIAAAGCAEVRANWSLTKRLTEILAIVGAA